MSETTSSETILYKQWVLRLRVPVQTNSTKLLLMLHGWTGDENSMQIFQRNIPEDYWIIAPRGWISTPEGGYGWIGHKPGREATLEAFLKPAAAIQHLIEDFRRDYLLSGGLIDLIGFSQGAALSLAFCLQYPEMVGKAAILSGFLPFMPENYQPPYKLSNIQFFIAHGSQDEIVSIERAYEVANFLENANAVVHFCHSPVGHRISSACFRQLNRFFAN